jgi:hypothetical protein
LYGRDIHSVHSKNKRQSNLGHNYETKTTGARSKRVTKKVLETVLVSRVIPSSQKRLHRKGGGIKASKPKKRRTRVETRKQQKAC